MDQTMLMNKERFLKTEFGAALEALIREWDSALETEVDENGVRRGKCLAQWEVYQLAMKQFYGIEFHFTRTDEYFGVCTEDGEDWLLKISQVPVNRKNEDLRKREALCHAIMETMETVLSTDLFIKAAQRCQEDYRRTVSINIPLMAESVAGRYERILNEIGN